MKRRRKEKLCLAIKAHRKTEKDRTSPECGFAGKKLTLQKRSPQLLYFLFIFVVYLAQGHVVTFLEALYELYHCPLSHRRPTCTAVCWNYVYVCVLHLCSFMTARHHFCLSPVELVGSVINTVAKSSSGRKGLTSDYSLS